MSGVDIGCCRLVISTQRNPFPTKKQMGCNEQQDGRLPPACFPTYNFVEDALLKGESVFFKKNTFHQIFYFF